MARVIQTHIKTPLADEVLFGRLKNGGTVRVVTAGSGPDSKLVFVFPDGPVLPRPDKEIVEAGRKKAKAKAEPEVRAKGRKGKETAKAED
jgi:ATP-dependent Clp protease ATP-binding subunit ClpA